jgi:hypothetical protein
LIVHIHSCINSNEINLQIGILSGGKIIMTNFPAGKFSFHLQSGPHSRICYGCRHIAAKKNRANQPLLLRISKCGVHLDRRDDEYYVSYKPVIPVSAKAIYNIFECLLQRNIELRFIPLVGDVAGRVNQSSLQFSLIRMKNAVYSRSER